MTIDTFSKKVICFILISTFTFLIYIPTNLYHVFPPSILPFLFIDNWIPFLPWTIWIYFSLYLFLPVGYFCFEKEENIKAFAINFVILQLIAALFFFFFPVSYPRHLFPLVEDGGSTFYFFNLLRQWDDPSNCIPSLHVANVFILAFSLNKESQRKGIIFLIWSALIAVSTLTTKQHYFWDVLAGISIAYVLFRFLNHNVFIRWKA